MKLSITPVHISIFSERCAHLPHNVLHSRVCHGLNGSSTAQLSMRLRQRIVKLPRVHTLGLPHEHLNQAVLERVQMPVRYAHPSVAHAQSPQVASLNFVANPPTRFTRTFGVVDHTKLVGRVELITQPRAFAMHKSE